MVQIIVAIIGFVATICGALIASRRRDPHEASTPVPVGAPLSKSTWISGICLVLAIVPILSFLLLPFGFYTAVNDKGVKRGWRVGLILCYVAFVLALANAIWGWYLSAHCQMFYQHLTIAGCVTG